MAIPSRAGFNVETQREIAYWISRGFTQADAARRAGVPQSPRLSAFFRSKAFPAILAEVCQERLSQQLVPKALDRLEELLERPDVQDKVRLDALKTTLDRGGLPAIAALKSEDERRPEDLTAEQLIELIASLEREKSGRALAVDGSHEFPEPVDNCSPLDFME